MDAYPLKKSIIRECQNVRPDTNHLGMTLDTFAKRFGVKHPTVIKWEGFKDKHTNMSLGTEKDIRLCLMGHLTGKKQISALYNELASLSLSPTEHQENVELDLDLEKIAI